MTRPVGFRFATANGANAEPANAPVLTPNPGAQIEYWKHGINLSMHLNDMCIRLRVLSLTVLGTFYAAAAISMAQFPNGIVSILGIEAHIWATLYFIAIIFIGLLWVLDQAYYYPMLIASVENSEAAEPGVQSQVQIEGGTTLTHRLTAAIPRGVSWRIANLFYFAQVLITTAMIVGASATHALAPTAPTHPLVQLGPGPADAAQPVATTLPPLTLRGRDHQE